MLELLEAGKITAEEAARLLEALAAGERKSSGKVKFLRIYVEDDGERVNIKVPLGLVRWAERFMPAEAKAVIADKEINLAELLEQAGEAEGEILRVEGEDGERVIITVE